MSRSIPTYEEIIAKNILKECFAIEYLLSDKPDLQNDRYSIGIEHVSNIPQDTRYNLDHLTKGDLNNNSKCTIQTTDSLVSVDRDAAVMVNGKAIALIHGARCTEGLIYSIKYKINSKLEKLNKIDDNGHFEYKNFKQYGLFIYDKELYNEKVIIGIQNLLIELQKTDLKRKFDFIYVYNECPKKIYYIDCKGTKEFQISNIQKIYDDSYTELLKLEN